MPKHIKIIIVGHLNDQVDVVNTLLRRSIDASAPLISKSQFQIDGQPLEIELRRTKEGVPTILGDANVFLYILPGGDFIGDTLNNADNIIEKLQRDYLAAHQSHLLPILLVRDASDNTKKAQEAFRNLTEQQYLLNQGSLEIIVREAIRAKRYSEDQVAAVPPQLPTPAVFSAEETVTRSAQAGQNVTPAAVASADAASFQHQQVSTSPISSATSASKTDQDNQEKSPPLIISRFFGAALRLVFGAVVGLVVYNPISSVFAALSAVQRDYSDKQSNTRGQKVAGALVRLLFSPVLGPLKGLLFDGIYRQTRRGWFEGFTSSFRPFYEIAREANLKDFKLRVFSEEKVAQWNETGTPISRRNIIAGIIISSLVIAAALAVVLLPVNAAVGISAAAQYGLSALTLWQLAVVAVSMAFAASTFLYGIGVACNKWLHTISEATIQKEPNYLSKLLGAMLGFCVGAVTSLLINNPIAIFYAGCRLILWRGIILGLEGSSSKKMGSKLERFLLYPILFIILPIILPFLIFISQPFMQGGRGWEKGLLATLGYTKDYRSAYADVVHGNDDIEGRDVIASLVVTALVAGAVLAILIPPLSMFLGIPALLTTIGLSGLAPWALALIGASATFVAGSVIYGIGSKLYDLSMHEQAETNTPKQVASIPSSYQQMQNAGVTGAASAPSASPSAAAALNAGGFAQVAAKSEEHVGTGEQQALLEGAIVTHTL